MRRFFFHFNKAAGRMTVHWKGQCIPVDDIRCEVPTETKWRSRQPRIVMQGLARDVAIVTSGGRTVAIINNGGVE